jgi:hypothetical protein
MSAVRSWCLPVAAAALLPLCGCLSQKIVVQVQPDGSGFIAVSRVFTPQGAAMVEMSMKEMKQEMAGAEVPEGISFSAPEDPFFDETQLKREARLFGRGVELVRAQSVGKDGAKGSVAIYRFKDINQIRLPWGEEGQGMMGAAMMSMEGDMADNMMDMVDDEDSILFMLAKGEPNRLRIQMPAALTDAVREANAGEASGESAGDEEMEADEEEAEAIRAASITPAVRGGLVADRGEMPFDFSDATSAEDMMRKAYRGMKMSLYVGVQGEVVSSTASHRSADRPQRLAIYDFDLEKFAATGKLERAMSGGPDMFMRLVAAAGTGPGMIVETNAEVVVEFK